VLIPVLIFFFFQAEDGIRDLYVTGVQTCALPIWTGQDRTHMVVVSESLDRIVTSNVNSGTISIIEQVSPPASGFGPPPGSNAPRSEERRVGKECRSRWSW